MGVKGHLRTGIWESGRDRPSKRGRARNQEDQRDGGGLKGIMLAAGDVTAACAELLKAGWGVPDL